MKSMKFLLDTNAVSDIARSVPAVKSRFSVMPAWAFGVSAITVMEAYYGLYRNPMLSSKVVRDMDEILITTKVIDFTAPAADKAGRIRAFLESKGTPISLHDLMIAGVALTSDLTLVTANTREFSRVPGLRLENWRIPVNEVREERVPYRVTRLRAA